MSNWITDNKPAAIVAGAGLVLFLGLTIPGYLINAKRNELDNKIKTARATIELANKAQIRPSRTANKTLEKELNTYAKAVDSLVMAYKPFQAASQLVNSTTPTVFQNELKSYRDALIASCKKKNIFITDTSNWLGFQVYSSQAPSTQAAPTLSFELKAINSLVNNLTDCGVTKFIKVYRPQLSIETTAENQEENEDALSQTSWTPMPLEITFQGDRGSMLKAMNAIINSKEYLFTVNSIRIRNERLMPPPIAKQEPAKPTVTQPAVGAASLTPEDEVAPSAPAIKQVVKPYMGNEQVFVQVSLNLIHFNQSQPQETAEN